MNSRNSNDTVRQLVIRVAAVIVLSFCLIITTYALVMVTVSMPENFFQTGNVEINLNDSEPVIEEHEFTFEPGMTVTKEFFLENCSTWDVYYKIYFDEVKGGLAKILDITIQDGEKVLIQGTAAELSRRNVKAAEDTLRRQEIRNLTIYFHYPENADNETQPMSLSFKLCAEAVQKKNNPNRQFD